MGRPGNQQPPNARDVAARALILKQVVVYAFVAPPRDMLAQIMDGWPSDEKENFRIEGEHRREEFWSRLGPLQSEMSPLERRYAVSTMLTMSRSEQVNASWRVEAFQVLLWALGILERLPPYDTPANHDILKSFPPADPGELLRTATLVPGARLEQVRDDAELWHWRCRTRQLIERGDRFPDDAEMRATGLRTYDDVVRFTARRVHEEGRFGVLDEDFAALGKPYRALDQSELGTIGSITVERHFALNWLCGHAPSNRWDDTPTNT